MSVVPAKAGAQRTPPIFGFDFAYRLGRRLLRLTRTCMATPPNLDEFIAAASAALDLPLDPAWQASIKANLEVTLRHATMVAEFPLPDEAEPAPIFKA